MLENMLERHDRSMQRMHDMMDRLEVDVVEAARARHGGALLSAIRACRACRSGATCARWLYDVRTEGQAPSFCPNSEFFLAHRRPR